MQPVLFVASYASFSCKTMHFSLMKFLKNSKQMVKNSLARFADFGIYSLVWPMALMLAKPDCSSLKYILRE